MSTDQVDGNWAGLRKEFLSRNIFEKKPKESVDSQDFVFHINLVDNLSKEREDIAVFT